MTPAKDAVDVGIIAADPAQLVAFYVDTLGLQFVEEFETRVGRINRLRFGSSFLKIVEGGPAVRVGASTDFQDAGVRYLTFEITDIEDVWERAVGSGAEVESPLQPLGEAGGLVGMFRDPEGNLVEILRRT